MAAFARGSQTSITRCICCTELLCPDSSPSVDRSELTEAKHVQRRLKYFEEVFTSEHWMMRIYRVRCCFQSDTQASLIDSVMGRLAINLLYHQQTNPPCM